MTGAFRRSFMAITVTGTVVVDETSGTQNATDTSDSSGNDIAGGAGVLPAELDQVFTDLGLSSASAAGVAVSGATADASTGTAMITGLPAGITDLSFTDSAGAALDGVDSGLDTTDGTSILLYTYSGDNNVLLGRKGGASGDIVFVAYLDTMTAAAGDAGATEAKVWLVQFESMHNPDATDPDDPVAPSNVVFVTASQLNAFSLSGAPSGQNLFLMYGTPGDGDAGNGDEVALVVTAKNAASGGTVNTGQGGGGTTLGSNNQMVDPNEGLVFTFVTNANSDFTVPNLDQNEADLAANIQFGGVFDSSKASFSVVQTQPASKACTLSIKAFNTAAEPGAAFVAGLSGDSAVAVNGVVVKDAGGNVIETLGDTDNDGLTITVSGGVATIVGVKAGYTIEYTTSGTHNRVEIDNSGSGHGPNSSAFDIGGFSLSNTVGTPTLFPALAFEDDGPALGFGDLIGTGTVVPQTGFWSMDAGADGLGTAGLDISLTGFTLVRPDNSTAAGTFTFNESSGSPDVNGNFLFTGQLTGDFDNNAATADTSVDFSLTAFADGHYALDLVQGFASAVVLSSADGSLDAGGPDPVRTLTIGSEQIVFFAAKPLAPQTGADSIQTGIGVGETDPTEAQLQTTPLPAFIGSSSMNVSTSGIGVANNVFQGNNTVGFQADDESFVVNPLSLITGMKVFIDNSVAGYNTATEDLFYRVYYSDGSVGATTEVNSPDLHSEAGGQVSFTIQREGTKMIDAVQLLMGRGDIKIPVIQFITETASLASDLKLDFSATVTDGDGDTASDVFSAVLNANELNAAFDFILTGTAGAPDAFDVDLDSAKSTYQVAGFDAGDKLVLLGAPPASVTIDNSGADSIVSILEAGGQTTTVTVLATDLLMSDIV
jgi:hypothetical protein